MRQSDLVHRLLHRTRQSCSALEVVLGLLLILLAVRFARSRKGLRLPPGPTGIPFLGVALQIPPDKQWLKFHKWIVGYGMSLLR